MMNTYALGQEVKVTFGTGDSYIGKVVDHAPRMNAIYVEVSSLNNDWLLVSLERETVELVQSEKASECLKTLKELKEAIADELKGQWYDEIESVKVAVYNSEEDGEEVYDCEVQIVLDNGDSIYPTFGTFYNEKDALAYARTMRTKLKRTYDISEQVFVYTC